MLETIALKLVFLGTLGLAAAVMIILHFVWFLHFSVSLFDLPHPKREGPIRFFWQVLYPALLVSLPVMILAVEMPYLGFLFLDFDAPYLSFARFAEIYRLDSWMYLGIRLQWGFGIGATLGFLLGLWVWSFGVLRLQPSGSKLGRPAAALLLLLFLSPAAFADIGCPEGYKEIPTKDDIQTYRCVQLKESEKIKAPPKKVSVRVRVPGRPFSFEGPPGAEGPLLDEDGRVFFLVKSLSPMIKGGWAKCGIRYYAGPKPRDTFKRMRASNYWKPGKIHTVSRQKLYWFHDKIRKDEIIVVVAAGRNTMTFERKLGPGDRDENCAAVYSNHYGFKKLLRSLRREKKRGKIMVSEGPDADLILKDSETLKKPFILRKKREGGRVGTR